MKTLAWLIYIVKQKHFDTKPLLKKTMNSELDSVDLNIRRDTERIRQKRRSKNNINSYLMIK